MKVSNNSSATFEFLKSRWSLTQTLDEQGKMTTDPSQMKVFGFDYVTQSGKSLGNIVLSLLSEDESAESMKIYFGKDISHVGGEEQKEFYKFLTSLRIFAKSHMMGFNVRDINRNQLNQKSMSNMFESIQFGELGGSVRTSRQPLDTLKLIIKHSDRVNPESRGARSRKIDKIFLANDKGERFLLPFTSLKGARAIARHASNGGTPYDAIGEAICAHVDEVSCLNKFLRVAKAELSDPVVMTISELVKIRVQEIKKLLTSLCSAKGYEKNNGRLIPQEVTMTGVGEPSEVSIPGLGSISESLENEMPYIVNLLRGKSMVSETSEFRKWINKTQINEIAVRRDLSNKEIRSFERKYDTLVTKYDDIIFDANLKKSELKAMKISDSLYDSESLSFSDLSADGSYDVENSDFSDKQYYSGEFWEGLLVNTQKQIEALKKFIADKKAAPKEKIDPKMAKVTKLLSDEMTVRITANDLANGEVEFYFFSSKRLVVREYDTSRSPEVFFKEGGPNLKTIGFPDLRTFAEWLKAHGCKERKKPKSFKSAPPYYD